MKIEIVHFSVEGPWSALGQLVASAFVRGEPPEVVVYFSDAGRERGNLICADIDEAWAAARAWIETGTRKEQL